MANYYYGDYLLPEIPVEKTYTAILKSIYGEAYYLCTCVQIGYHNTSGQLVFPYAEKVTYRIPTGENYWTFNSSSSFAAKYLLSDSAGEYILIWSSYDVPEGSATATEIYFEGSEPIPEGGAHTHSYTEAVTTEPTCTTEGVKTFTCECGDSYTEAIPMVDHNYVDGACTVCGATDPSHTHSYTETVSTPATCTEAGEKTFTCECGHSYTEAIPATGHDYVNGTCSRCGAIDPEGADRYIIQRTTLEAIGDQVRRLCGHADETTLGPLKMAEDLENLNIELEEVYVSATTEEQTIYPSEGYYGISKVTVEAVEEDSGGGGSGGSGGAAEDTTFGDEYTEEETETGNLDYSGGEDENPFYLPPIPGGVYQALFCKKLERGSLYRFSADGISTDVRADSDIYVFGTYGSYISAPYLHYSGLVFAYSENESVTFHTKSSSDTNWRDEEQTSANPYGDGYCKVLWTMGGYTEHLDHTPQLDVSGVPCFNVGFHGDSESLMAAMYNFGDIISENSDSRLYLAFGSETQILYADSAVNNIDNSPMTIYEYDSAESEAWEELGETDGSDYPVDGFALVWTSHDLLDMSGENVTQESSGDPIPEIETTTTTTPVEVEDSYTISGESLNSIIAAAQKITGTTEPMTVAQATKVLEDYYASQQETTGDETTDDTGTTE